VGLLALFVSKRSRRSAMNQKLLALKSSAAKVFPHTATTSERRRHCAVATLAGIDSRNRTTP
ncbi:hypothetical protein, partial [Cupriavidus necator]